MTADRRVMKPSARLIPNTMNTAPLSHNNNEGSAIELTTSRHGDAARHVRGLPILSSASGRRAFSERQGSAGFAHALAAIDKGRDLKAYWGLAVNSDHQIMPRAR